MLLSRYEGKSAPRNSRPGCTGPGGARRRFLPLTAVALGMALGVAPAASESALPEGVVTAVEELLAGEMSRQQIPGLSIAVVVDRQLVWSNGYGLADVENNVPATVRTVYRSASIGKTFTAVAAMQLAAAGELDLEAPIQRTCPAFPEKRWPVTARQLLRHLGGVRAYPDDPEAFAAEFFSVTHYEDVIEPLALFKDDPLLHEPGSRYQYSSYGYSLLGCAIAGASGEKYYDYVRANIFEKAGMRHTRNDDPSAVIPGRARGYVLTEGGELRNSRHVDMSNKLPARGFVTTAGDLARFAAAFMGDELVSAETRREMLEPGRTGEGEVVAYGLGWGLMPDEDWYGHQEAFHGGGTPQVAGMLYLLPDAGFAVAILMNREGVQDRLGTAAKIARIVLDLGE